MRKTLLVFMVLTLLGCQGAGGETPRKDAMNTHDTDQLEVATLAGGCFWCVESDMEKLDGVVKAVSGYAGGHVEVPSYEEVTTGRTGHREAVQVHFDPSVITYAEVLDAFWRHIDPTDPDGSFGDRGFQYSPAVFYHDETQREIAEQSRQQVQESGVFEEDIATEVIPFTNFYKAEDYHQDYYKTHAARYKTYRHFSGRDRFIEKHWGQEKHDAASASSSAPAEAPSTAPGTSSNETTYSRPDNDALRSMLTPLQYKITQREGTEPPFDNEFWDNKRPGIYVDVVSGEPLFSSAHKYKSGTGWPSFDRPLVPENIVEKEDRSLFSVRTEVRSKYADSHLGHVFSDGPPTTGLRYCINSAALRFVPRENMAEQGYAAFLKGL